MKVRYDKQLATCKPTYTELGCLREALSYSFLKMNRHQREWRGRLIGEKTNVKGRIANEVMSHHVIVASKLFIAASRANHVRMF